MLLSSVPRVLWTSGSTAGLRQGAGRHWRCACLCAVPVGATRDGITPEMFDGLYSEMMALRWQRERRGGTLPNASPLRPTSTSR